jgi:two-component sensor histidine kinase
MANDASTARNPTDPLALALIAASDTPILLLDGEMLIIAASGSFLRAFQIDPAGCDGRSIFALGGGEWDVPQLRSLLRLTLAGQAGVDSYEMDLKRPSVAPRRLVIKAQRLSYGDEASPRIVVAITDVTESRLAERLKDDLLREKAILYQELQHRVANSLQIIASVLMQSARRLPADQTRGVLYDAHSRVMSVAALQQQLVASRAGDVALGAYFTELCQSIGASMIQDRETLRLRVDADASVAMPDASVSLGLIVTELVINALKHAFPGNRGGDIVVSYHSSEGAWTLSVADDGVGMAPVTKAGLGTNIVEALAKQLNAVVTISDAEPGTRVSVVGSATAAEAPMFRIASAVAPAAPK